MEKEDIEDIRKTLSDPFAKYRSRPVSLRQVRILFAALETSQLEAAGLREVLRQVGEFLVEDMESAARQLIENVLARTEKEIPCGNCAEMRQRLLEVGRVIQAAPNMEIDRDNLLAMIKSLTEKSEKKETGG